MFEYLQKFKELPAELREAVSGPAAVKALGELEAKYGLSLADIIIRLMVKDIALSALPALLISEQKMELMRADELFTELKAGVLAPVLKYLDSKAEVHVGIKQPVVINAVKATAEVARSPFFFDAEDELEVRAHAEKASLPIDANQIYYQQAEELIKKLELSFGSEILLERLKNTLVTYLKGIRNRVDTKLALNKPVEQGGVNLDDNVIESIFREADSIKKTGEQENKKIDFQNKTAAPDVYARGSKEDLERLKAVGGRDFEYDLSALEQKSNQPKEVENQEPTRGKGRPRMERESFDVADSDPFSYRRPKEAIGKVVMSDVKVSLPKVMGPLDELHYMDMTIFRRIAKQPQVATEKIKEKIALLEAEMYGKRLEGIKVWRNSPLYKEYLRIGQESIKSGRTVSEVIDDLQQNKINSLSLPEFEAIMKLNRELRF